MQSMAHSALLLAGGKSSRMGRDKAHLIVGGEPLWQRQVSVLRATGPEAILLSAPKRPPFTSADGLILIPDVVEGLGPLAGLSAGLAACESDWLLVLAVDVPRVSAELLQGLLATADSTGRGVVPVDRHGRSEPLVAVYPQAAAPLAARLLEQGERRLSVLLERLLETEAVRYWEIPSKVLGQFQNWNTPEDVVE
jgi:molybdenum cofactor guanylyltransferase